MVQVELAQWEYRLPRLTRMWTHLARQAGGRAGGSSGGVGVRGPGETQIELDRREIRHRIAVLDREIEHLRQQRGQSRRHRRQSGLPSLSLVGYTNAGKSTLLNTLTKATVFTADQLFATLDPTTRRLAMPSGREALISDTVGLIQKLPTQLVASFRATLEEIADADLLIHVVDLTHPDAAQQAETVERILRDLGMVDPAMVVAGNKADALPGFRAVPKDGDGAPRDQVATAVGWDGGEPEALAALRELYPDLVPISARLGAGMAELLTAVDRELRERLVRVEAVIPYDAGATLNLVHLHGIVESEEYEPHGTRIRALVPTRLVGPLRALGASDPNGEGAPGPGTAPD
jgi:GTP-binding protein HflX